MTDKTNNHDAGSPRNTLVGLLDRAIIYATYRQPRHEIPVAWIHTLVGDRDTYLIVAMSLFRAGMIEIADRDAGTVRLTTAGIRVAELVLTERAERDAQADYEAEYADDEDDYWRITRN